ncbi:MAG: bifunctional DNA-binding transcriptional regulator/O6-methylguanine-DNA methyltransferase Ada [Gammaproteobacteria bacterium]|nr:bifunctional DNA-binding transcriptional regulator/O6-methylguanine-DNA methyltransferase Ada [Gammaproteobacteria bacterium]
MITERQKFAALAARDASLDGRFVYAVITTGVYCRPSCPARPARRENVRFFDNGPAAQAAGFRPCRRCRPDEPIPGYADLVAVARRIEARSDEPISLAQLAQGTPWSPARLQRAFKAAFGVTPKAYQNQLRLNGFKGALRSGDSVTQAIHTAGFGSTSRVYGATTRNIGMTPSAYRAGGAGETIAYACRDTSLGPLLMAATDRGVCFAQFGEDPDALFAQLEREFPAAELHPSRATDSPQLDAWLDALEAHLGAGAPRPELPLDLRGSAFQVKVWSFLLSIRDGEVMSYSEVAAGIHQPKAVRAVASACGANRIAVLVPCHRVLRSDGSVGGYRWGIERKRVLLDSERSRRSTS